MHVASPFGDGPNDVRVTDLRDAVLSGIERDVLLSSHSSRLSISRRRLHFSEQQQDAAAAGSDLKFVAATTDSSDQHDFSGYHHMPFPNI
jgi:hypothetical protein